MPVTRNEVPVEDRWNVEALYVDPQNWKEDLEDVKGGGGNGPSYPGTEGGFTTRCL